MSLGLALIATWAVLSGRLDNVLLVTLGSISILLVLILVERMRILGEEGAPYHRLLALIRYLFWLGGEITKANIIVAREVLRADLDITPRMFRVKPAQTTDQGRALFANSITLTPGTVTVALDDGEFLVHALLDILSDPADLADMNERAKRAAEGPIW